MWIYSIQKQFFHSVILRQEMWLFNIAMRQKDIQSMFIYDNDHAASTSTKIKKIK